MVRVSLYFEHSETHRYVSLSVFHLLIDSGPSNDTGRGQKRNFGGKKARPAGGNNDYAKRPRNSLRIGAQGKKGRSAQKNMSRGSLRRRDRSKEKERKLEAAIERKTIQLPE